jgi:hypothetical protein
MHKPAGTFILKQPHIAYIESVSLQTAARRIKEVHDLLIVKRPGKHAKITLKEYAEHYQLPLADLITQLNEKFILHITI